MKSRSIVLAGALVAALVSATGSGSAFSTIDAEEEILGLADQSGITNDDIGETYTKLPPAVTDTIDLMGSEACAFGLSILAAQGWGVPEDRDKLGYEYEPLNSECKDFRDALTHRVWDGDDPPYLQVCSYTAGMNCVAVGHYACDFALLLDSGLVYVCLGGLTPYN